MVSGRACGYWLVFIKFRPPGCMTHDLFHHDVDMRHAVQCFHMLKVECRDDV